MSPCDPSVWPTLDVGVDRAAPWQDIMDAPSCSYEEMRAITGRIHQWASEQGFLEHSERVERALLSGAEFVMVSWEPEDAERDDDVAFFDSVEAAESEERPIQARLDEAGRVLDVVGPAAVPWATRLLREIEGVGNIPLLGDFSLGVGAIAEPLQSGRAIQRSTGRDGRSPPCRLGTRRRDDHPRYPTPQSLIRRFDGLEFVPFTNWIRASSWSRDRSPSVSYPYARPDSRVCSFWYIHTRRNRGALARS